MTLIVKELAGNWSRGIVIGDVHGCINQLKALLRKVNFSNSVSRSHPNILQDDHDSSTLVDCNELDCNSTDDLCIFVGDLVNKGPDSYGVVKLLKAIGAVGVRGNHDEKFIARCKKESIGKNDSSLQSCFHDVVEFLDNLPHIIYFPIWNMIVVHAGLDPSLPLSLQSMSATTHMRRLALKTDFKREPKCLSSSNFFFAFERKIGSKWFKVWNDVMKKKFDPEVCCGESFFRHCTVVYGHDAKSSLQIKKFSIGLDSGCVYGGCLTALVVPEKVIVDTPGFFSS